MSLVLFLFSTAIAIAVRGRRHRYRTAIWVLGSSLGVIATVLIFGAFRLALPPGNQTIQVGLIASDAPGNQYMAASGAPAMRLFRSYAGQVSALAARGAKVIVLPEKIAVVVPATQSAMDALFQPLSDRTGAVIVVGVDLAATRQMKYNEARIYTPNKPVRTYVKHHLLSPFEADMTPGIHLASLATPSGLWGVEICKDMDFTQLSRQYGNLGVGLMLVPGLDFDIDRAFHGHMAIMRGVESGFSIAHSARRGFLTVSDDRGRILGQARSDSAPFATVLVNVPVAHNATIYQALGDWFAWIALALLLLALASVFGRTAPNTCAQTAY